MTKIFVAGHNGMVGSAICRHLKNTAAEIVTAERDELDLINQSQVRQFFKTNNFDEVYLAAAKVGGIHANNTYPADFIYDNLMIQSNIIDSANRGGVQKLMFLGSSCIYPKFAPQPITEDVLLTGALESTNEPYGIAKIAGIKMCESYNRQYGRDYRSVMPTNLYGPFDNFHSENSHVIPALVRRFHEAKISQLQEVTAWGTGAPMREFLHVDDMAAACIHIMNLDLIAHSKITMPTLSHINVGSGEDCSIKKLTETIAHIVEYTGKIKWDTSRPDGTLRKLMSADRLRQLGWKPSISLEVGLRNTYDWYKSNFQVARK